MPPRPAALAPLVLLFAAAVCLQAQQEPAAAATPATGTGIHYLERESMMPVDGIRLDILEVRVDSPEPHPLAILTHGTAADAASRARVTPWAQLPQALWLAEHGFVAVVVVRRGYGRSGGRPDTVAGGCSNSGSFVNAGENSADDLREVVEIFAKEPYVDKTRVLSLGVSTGGFAQVALSAEPPPGLKAAISFAGGRGGDGKGNNCDLDGLVGAFKYFGKRSKVPMLWLYAENDKWFPPSMSTRFEKAFHDAGGQDQFQMVPPDGEDGHGYYRHIAAWAPRVEAFLRAQHLLPLETSLPPPRAPEIAPPADLHENGQAAFRQFLISGPYRAFATNGSGYYGYSTGQFDQQAADEQALANCAKASKGSDRCAIASRGTGH